MNIYLLRHGETTYNAEQRYQGSLDIPLSAKGRAELAQADISPDAVFVSPLCRAQETAAILFPAAKQIVIPDLREMCFGSFEGKNYMEMERDPAYTTWVNSNCESPCPNGECKADFCARSCAAFEKLVDQAFDEEQPLLVILAHGGTQMAVMERYALPHRDYFAWNAPNAGGYLLETNRETWRNSRIMCLVDTVQYVWRGGAQ